MTWLNLYTALKPQEFGLEKKNNNKKKVATEAICNPRGCKPGALQFIPGHSTPRSNLSVHYGCVVIHLGCLGLQGSLLDMVCKDRSNFPFPSLTWPPKASVVGVVEAPISDQRDLGRYWVFAVLSQPSGLQSWGKKELSCSLCPKPHKETLCSSVTQRILLLGNCFLIYAFHIIPVTLTFGIKTQDGVNKPFS